MPRSSRPRKKYRPYGVNFQSHYVAMHGAALLTLDDRTTWAVELDAAITDVGRGQATLEQWDAIFAAVALAEQLVRDGVARDTGGVIAAAQQACVDILGRTGSRAVRASELAALRDLQANWVALLDNITHTQKFQAEERIAIRKKSSPNVKVRQPCP